MATMQANKTQDLKQKTRKSFILALEIFLLAIFLFCAPLWFRWPSGSYAVDFPAWALASFSLFFTVYALLHSSRQKKFGASTTPIPLTDFLFNLMTTLFGMGLIALALLWKKWDHRLTPLGIGLLGVVLIFTCTKGLHRLATQNGPSR